jgi:hypothetical protein
MVDDARILKVLRRYDHVACLVLLYPAMPFYTLHEPDAPSSTVHHDHSSTHPLAFSSGLATQCRRAPFRTSASNPGSSL